jgi:hypothetical protein
MNGLDNVKTLIDAMAALRETFDLDCVSVTQKLNDGHELTLRAYEDTFELEREDGWTVFGRQT